MSKVAPALGALTSALTPQMLVGLGLTAAGSLLNNQATQANIAAQQAENRKWLNFQRQQAARFEQMDNEQRDRAKQGFMANLEGQTQENREQIIDAEADRLYEDYSQGLPDFARDGMELAEAGRSEVFDEALARKLADATSEARDRIKALAKASAFGGGTQFGMGQTLGNLANEAGTEIGFANDARRGNLGVLNRYQQVQPGIIDPRGSPMGDMLMAGGQVVGSMSGWPSFGGGSAAPKTSPIPKPRPANFSFLPVNQ